MAYNNTKTGCIAVGTVWRDSEYKLVGDNQTPRLKFSISVGKNDQNETVWFNCQAWRDLADYGNLLKIQKGDTVMVYGHWETNEYNGQTYQNLVLEWIDKRAKLEKSSISHNERSFQTIAEDIYEEDLPF